MTASPLAPDATQLDRREFVVACGGTVMLMLAGCASLVTHPVPVVAGRVRLPLSAYPDLAKPDGAIQIQPDSSADPVYVLALASGGYSAISPICTHRGCTVDVNGSGLVCPCHGSAYDREGHVLRGPAQRALRSYAVRREGDELVIEFGGLP